MTLLRLFLNLIDTNEQLAPKSNNTKAGMELTRNVPSTMFDASLASSTMNRKDCPLALGTLTLPWRSLVILNVTGVGACIAPVVFRSGHPAL